MTQIRVLRMHPSAHLPQYEREGDAGADLVSVQDVDLEPGQRALVPTGIAIELPAGTAAFVHPRSGLALKHGISVVNAPGTIDSGYRGEIQVLLVNLDTAQTVHLPAGTRIAQLVVQRVESAEFLETDSLTQSQRGSAGFGSTGMAR